MSLGEQMTNEEEVESDVGEVGVVGEQRRGEWWLTVGEQGR